MKVINRKNLLAQNTSKSQTETEHYHVKRRHPLLCASAQGWPFIKEFSVAQGRFTPAASLSP